MARAPSLPPAQFFEAWGRPLPELPPQLREAGWILVWDHDRQRQGEPSFRAEHHTGPTRWLATPEMAIDAAWHAAEPDHALLEALERVQRAEAELATLRQAHADAWTLLGRCDMAFELIGEAKLLGPAKKTAKELRAEIAKASGQ